MVGIKAGNRTFDSEHCGFPIRKRGARSKEQGVQGREECTVPEISFISLLFKILLGVLICNVVLVAGVQKRESVLQAYVSSLLDSSPI